jgi:hypothetical protein
MNPISAREYPLALGAVDGREVLPNIPNTDSISASLTNYEVLKGIREVPLIDIIQDPRTYFYAVDDLRRSEVLAERIKNSNQIAPIIVVMDSEGPYVLEGSHRVVALFKLKARSVPALVVIDKD